VNATTIWIFTAPTAIARRNRSHRIISSITDAATANIIIPWAVWLIPWMYPCAAILYLKRDASGFH
jgi:hypothetical protein